MIIKLPNQKAFVFSPGTVGLAICRAIIETHYPDAPRAALPECVTDQPWHVLCPRGEIAEGESVYGLKEKRTFTQSSMELREPADTSSPRSQASTSDEARSRISPGKASAKRVSTVLSCDT